MSVFSCLSQVFCVCVSLCLLDQVCDFSLLYLTFGGNFESGSDFWGFGVALLKEFAKMSDFLMVMSKNDL